jgi:hypothetical protein
MPSDFEVTLTGERGAEWERVIGRKTFPVRSPVPILAKLPGIPRAHVYLLDLSLIEPAVLEKIVAHMGAKFGLTPEEERQEIAEKGIPILDEDCMVTIHNPQKWLGDDDPADEWDDERESYAPDEDDD